MVGKWLLLLSIVFLLGRSTGFSSRLEGAPAYQAFTQAHEDLCLAARDDGPPYMASCRTDDLYQMWKKITPWDNPSDETGQPGYILSNVATHTELQHGNQTMDQVQSSSVDIDLSFEEVLLWSDAAWSNDDGFHAIRAMSNIRKNLDVLAVTGDFMEGATLVLFDWHFGLNQYWKFRMVA